MKRLLSILLTLLLSISAGSAANSLEYSFPEVEIEERKLQTMDKYQDHPQTAKLDQNYPNPFNPATTISYSLSDNSKVQIEIFNLLGRRMETLINESQSAGEYDLHFDASHLASGTYIYRLELSENGSGNNQVFTRKFSLIK